MTHAALKLALEALEGMQSYASAERKGLLICDEAITAIKAALAQEPRFAPAGYELLKMVEDGKSQTWEFGPAQQEPVAWMGIDEKGSASGLRYWSEPDNRHEVALYTKENT